MTVLVVDSDPLDSAEALRAYGFRVVTARDGDEATALLAQETDLVAVVTELELEGRLKGRDVAHLARERHPTIPIVYVSGCLDLFLATSSWENARFVRKPCVARVIVREVASLLEETSS